jgi:hypothetical protein
MIELNQLVALQTENARLIALLRMWEKRQRGYRAMGYRMAEEKDVN